MRPYAAFWTWLTCAALFAMACGAPQRTAPLIPTAPIATSECQWVHLSQRLLDVDVALTDAHRSVLLTIVSEAERVDLVTVRVEGHGCPADAMDETMARTEIVARGLVDLGLSRPRVTLVAYGAPRSCCQCALPDSKVGSKTNCRPCEQPLSPVESRRVEFSLQLCGRLSSMSREDGADLASRSKGCASNRYGYSCGISRSP